MAEYGNNVRAMLTFKAYAKVNLTLEVLGRRQDGYHDIVSIMQTVSLWDTLTLEPAEEIRLECDNSALQSEENLALRAARLLQETAGIHEGVSIHLKKAIPVSAGLGGGSSDAAAVLRGLNRLWDLGMSVEELMPLAAQLGSDVPFFLYGGTAMVQGRGERVRPLPPASLGWMVLLHPHIEVPNKTASLYRRLTYANFTPGALTRKLEARISGGGDAPAQFLFNVFDGVALDTFPGLKPYRDVFYELGAREIHLCGSGPTLFAPVGRRELGTALQLLLPRRCQCDAYLVSPVADLRED